MAGFACPRCENLFQPDAEGHVTCGVCGQLSRVPTRAEPLPAITPATVHMTFGSRRPLDWWERNEVTELLFLGVAGLAGVAVVVALVITLFRWVWGTISA
jgi:hypothetical protein